MDWISFSIYGQFATGVGALVGGSVGGLTGVLIAVPITLCLLAGVARILWRSVNRCQGEEYVRTVRPATTRTANELSSMKYVTSVRADSAGSKSPTNSTRILTASTHGER